MLIIPVTGKLSWRHPPLVTIGLIVINCLVFLFFQMGDNAKWQNALKFYFVSGLAEMEVERYLAYKGLPDQNAADPEADPLQDKILQINFGNMSQDESFVKALENEEIITPDDPAYADWRQLRNAYEKKLARITTYRYAFHTDEPSVITAFTHMFLHGGAGHLIGNMIFLWLVGCMLEMGSGKFFFLLTYLITGLCSVALYGLVYSGEVNHLVGASGAISGIMGAFTALYGRHRVRIFYSLGFYFNYIRVPAIALFPVWLLNEFYQLFFSGMTQVAYMAHIGGLLSGGIIGAVQGKVMRGPKTEALADPEPVDEVSPIVEAALERMQNLDMTEGDRLLESALIKDPGHTGVMTHLFNIRKNHPEDERFHAITRRLLQNTTRDRAKFALARNIFAEYSEKVTRPRLSPDLYFRMIHVFTVSGELENAERLIAMFLKQKPDYHALPTALLKLARAYRRKGNGEKAKKCLRVLRSRYPDSPEAQISVTSREGT